MIAASLAYLASRQGDNIALFAYRDSIVEAIEPGHRSGQLARLLQALSRLRPAGGADHDGLLQSITLHMRNRGLVIYLSDMLEAEESLPRQLSALQFRHCDCLAIQVLDPDERDLPHHYPVRYVDSETEARRHHLRRHHPSSISSVHGCLSSWPQECFWPSSGGLLVPAHNRSSGPRPGQVPEQAGGHHLKCLLLPTVYFLFALAGLAVPVILHLINREMVVDLKFPSVRFIDKTQLPRREKRRLRDLLLLLLRMALFAAVVLAFAQPIRITPQAAMAEERQLRQTVYVLDASSSMAEE